MDKSLNLLPIGLNVVVQDSVQLIGWVAPSCLCVYAILGGITIRLYCSILFILLTIYMMPFAALTSISNLKFAYWYYN